MPETKETKKAGSAAVGLAKKTQMPPQSTKPNSAKKALSFLTQKRNAGSTRKQEQRKKLRLWLQHHRQEAHSLGRSVASVRFLPQSAVVRRR